MILHKVYAIIGDDNIVNNIKIFNSDREAIEEAVNTQIRGRAVFINNLPVKIGDLYTEYGFERDGKHIDEVIDPEVRIKELNNVIDKLKERIKFLEENNG